MRRMLLIACAASLALVGSLGTSRAQGAPADAQKSDLEQIKETQKVILQRLDAQDKVLASILQRLQTVQAGGRPQIDPNKVYTIPVTAASQIKGPNNARVTLVEFSDYQ